MKYSIKSINFYFNLHYITSKIALFTKALQSSFLYSQEPLISLPKFNSSEAISEALIAASLSTLQLLKNSIASFGILAIPGLAPTDILKSLSILEAEAFKIAKSMAVFLTL